MNNKIQTRIYFLSLSIFIVLIDQFTKYLMFYNKKLFINQDFLLFKLDFVKNYGAAFNIFSGSRIFLSLISIFFSIILIYLIFRKNNLNTLDLYTSISRNSFHRLFLKMLYSKKMNPIFINISAILNTGKFIIFKFIKSTTNPLYILSIPLPIVPPRIKL